MSKLDLIAESSRRWNQTVITFDLGVDTLPGRAAGALPEVRAVPRPARASIVGDPLTRPFACAEHDHQLFRPIDGPEFDQDNPRHLALVSFRTLLLLLYEALSFSRALVRAQSTSEFAALPPSAQEWERAQLKRKRVEASSLRRAASAIYRQAIEGQEPEFSHLAVQLRNQPRVAFAGACARGGAALWTRRERQAAPEITRRVSQAAPFVLTCYPDRAGHVVVASCPRGLDALLPVVFPGFGDPGDGREALLSASALDLLDQLMMRPSAWDAYGEDRQERIWKRWARMPDGPRDALADRETAPLNLFN